jgi:hypothetical protein
MRRSLNHAPPVMMNWSGSQGCTVNDDRLRGVQSTKLQTQIMHVMLQDSTHEMQLVPVMMKRSGRIPMLYSQCDRLVAAVSHQATGVMHARSASPESLH